MIASSVVKVLPNKVVTWFIARIAASEDKRELAAQLPTRSDRARVNGVVVGAQREVDRKLVQQFDYAPHPAADRDGPLLAGRCHPIRRNDRRACDVPALAEIVIDE